MKTNERPISPKATTKATENSEINIYWYIYARYEVVVRAAQCQKKNRLIAFELQKKNRIQTLF